MSRWFIVVLCVVVVWCLGSGCNKPGATSSAGAPVDPTEPTQAQPRLPTLKLWVGPEELTAELALKPMELRTGMMFRTNMAENESMLFVFGVPHQASFWMKNTLVPLSAAYIDPEGVILEIHDLQPQNTNSVEASSDRVQYVLETRQGWFQRHGIGTGAVIRTERGALKDTFQFRRPTP